MSADGTTFIVGARLSDGNGGNSGEVSIYKFNATINDYKKFGLNIVGKAAGDMFGYALSMSADGTTFVVSAIYNNAKSVTHSSGYIRVYKLNKSANMYQQFGPDIDGETMGDLFGYSVSISADGSTFVVGAPSSVYRTVPSSGFVRVFKLNETFNAYTQFGIDIYNELAINSFGYQLSMSADGTTFVANAISRDFGQVSVYKFNSSSNGYEKFVADIRGISPSDRFGSSLSISADGMVFVAGARFSPDDNFGNIRVYKYNSSIKNYEKISSFKNGVYSYEYTDCAVSMTADGLTFVVVSQSNPLILGKIRVYRFNELINKYAQVGLDINGEAENDQDQGSVSMSADGLTFVVGAPFNNFNSTISDSGHVRIFKIIQVSANDTKLPSKSPTRHPVTVPVKVPTLMPTRQKTGIPTKFPSNVPTHYLTKLPTKAPTNIPKQIHTKVPTKGPTKVPSAVPIIAPRKNPTIIPTYSPTKIQTQQPTKAPRAIPVTAPLFFPMAPFKISPTQQPTKAPAPMLLSMSPVQISPVKVPHTSSYPTKGPTLTPIEVAPMPMPVKPPVANCGLHRTNWFCPCSRKCGFFRRLFKICGCG
jgi:hypothetical protein